MDSDISFIFSSFFTSPFLSCSERVYLHNSGDCAASSYQDFLHIILLDMEPASIRVEAVEYILSRFTKAPIRLVRIFKIVKKSPVQFHETILLNFCCGSLILMAAVKKFFFWNHYQLL